MTAPRKPGQVITFYSYKGGTGRSMALANMAWLLAMSGRRVVVIDWDLEAPGLHRYFHPFLSDPQLTASDGVTDFMIRFLEEASAIASDRLIPDDWFTPHADITPLGNAVDYAFPTGGLLDFIPAGRQGDAYAGRVNSFNWKHFYDKVGGWEVIAEMRRRLRDEYDFVLIDSRTGVADTAGICTVQIPDSVVICFTLNFQSVDGASAAARSIVEQRMARSEPVHIFPVPMRVEGSEKLKRDAVTAYAQKRFLGLLHHDDVSAAAREAYWDEVELPHVGFYAFEEQLAWFLDKPTQVSGVLPSIKRLTKYTTGVDVMNLRGPDVEERAAGLAAYSGVWSAPTEQPPAQTPKTDTLVSYNELDRDDAEQWLAASPAAGRSVQSAELSRESVWADTLRAVMQRAASVTVLVGRHGLSHRQQRELTLAFRHRFRVTQTGDKFPIVPVYLAGASTAEPLALLDAGVTAMPAMAPNERATVPAFEAVPACPYPGIRAFQVEESEAFHGREYVADRLLEQAKTSQLVVISGPPGSGRTSVVQAGLVPRLLAQGPPQPSWKAAFCSFAVDGLASLAEALVTVRQTSLSESEFVAEVQEVAAVLRAGRAQDIREVITASLASWPPADRLLVVADDVPDIQAASVAAWLQALKDMPATLVLIADGPGTIPPLSLQELRFAIVGPANDIGLEFEPGLAHALASDVERDRDALPLMQFCLRRLLEVRGAGPLTLQAYDSIGGARNAVGTWVERQLGTLEGVSDRGWRVLSRLITVASSGEWRTRTIPGELLDPAWSNDVDRLIDAGLLRKTQERGSARIHYSWSHEILGRRWPQFADRVAREAEVLTSRQELEIQAQTWFRSGGSLLSGSRLLAAQGLAGTYGQVLTTLEKEFVDSSRVSAAEREARYVAESQQSRRQRILAIGAAAVVLGTVMAIGAGLWFADSSKNSPKAATLQKVEGDGQTITAGSFNNFSVRVVDAAGAPVEAAKVAWQTPDCGMRTFVGATGPQGIASATNMCATIAPGEHEHRATIVDAQTPVGFFSGDAELTPIAASAVFKFRFSLSPIELDVTLQKGGTAIVGRENSFVGGDRDGIVNLIIVRFRQEQTGLVLKREMFYMVPTGEADAGGPIMVALSTGPGDATDRLAFPLGVRGVRFWLDGPRAAQYVVRYSVLLSNGSKTEATNSGSAGDWTPLRSSTQHQLVWLSMSIVPK